MVMYGCDSWTIKKAERRRSKLLNVVLEKTLESLLDCKEIQPVHPKGDQSWVFIGKTDVEAETPIVQPPDMNSWLFGKDPDAGKDWGLEEKGMTEDRWLDHITFSRDMVLCGLWQCMMDREAWRTAILGVTKGELNWTELNWSATADDVCSHEIKRRLLLGRKIMTNLDSILKSRDITLPTKVCLVKAMVFPVVMYECESWTVKKAEHRITDAFELWCWRRLLRVLWTARRSNQSILKEISPGISLGGMMLKLKLQYFGHLIRRVDSLKKTLNWEGLVTGGKGDDRGWDGWMASLTRWTWVWVNSGRWWWTGRPGVLQFMGLQWVRHDQGLNYLTELKWRYQNSSEGFQEGEITLKQDTLLLYNP